MPKQVTFKLNQTLKCGSQLYLKGTIFDEEHLPAELKQEVESGSHSIEIITFGDDLEGTEFNPDETVSMKKPEKKIIPKKRKVKV